ncbi:MAG: hypothetical protein M3R13_02900 [Armatimonadota bacterium]|nr:hypothetical protein [Armatimonadota bacterium]
MIAYRFADTPQDRPRHRMTLDYNATPTIQVGAEYNFAVEELGFRATWIVLQGNEKRPTIFFNTSSDRIGTPEGYQLVSANFGYTIPGTKFSPYFSITYSGFEHGFVFPFGASYSFSPQWTLVGMNDGRRSHALLTYSQASYFIQAGWIWFKHPAVTVGWGF